MAVPPREAPAPPGFRRRIPLELSAEQLALLEQSEKRYGTKRATLIAGLEALDRLESLERELTNATTACEAAAARASEAEKKQAALERELAKAKEAAASAKRGKQAAEREGKESGAKANVQADTLARLLEDEREARADIEEELADAQSELFDALLCARCGKWAEPKDWAVKEEADGDYVYHRPCGFHRGGVLDTTSLLGFRERD